MRFFWILCFLISCAQKTKTTQFQPKSNGENAISSSDSGDRVTIAKCDDDTGKECGVVSEVKAEESEFNLILGSDYDSSFNIAQANNVNWTLYYDMQNSPRTTRNNKFSDIVFGWRASTDSVTVRKPVAQFGAGTFTKSGIATNSARGTVRFRPNMAKGTYYLYFKFLTNGEDVNTSIFRIVIL